MGTDPWYTSSLIFAHLAPIHTYRGLIRASRSIIVIDLLALREEDLVGQAKRLISLAENSSKSKNHGRRQQSAPTAPPLPNHYLPLNNRPLRLGTTAFSLIQLSRIGRDHDPMLIEGYGAIPWLIVVTSGHGICSRGL
eukprot:scaffold30385_cov63-Cyclotella_meneghiniana.AAC.4